MKTVRLKPDTTYYLHVASAFRRTVTMRGASDFTRTVASKESTMRSVTVRLMSVAAAVAIVLVVRLWRVTDAVRQAAMVLIATVLMTPYMHNYDLALLLSDPFTAHTVTRITAWTLTSRRLCVRHETVLCAPNISR